MRWTAVVQFLLWPAEGSTFSWYAVMSHSSVSMLLPLFSAPMNCSTLSCLIPLSVKTSYSFCHDCLFYTHTHTPSGSEVRARHRWLHCYEDLLLILITFRTAGLLWQPQRTNQHNTKQDVGLARPLQLKPW